MTRALNVSWPPARITPPNWYEPALLQPQKMESLDPYDLPLSYNFYGWSKATYEHLGFLFACGAFGRKMGMVLVRIGSPGEIGM